MCVCKKFGERTEGRNLAIAVACGIIYPRETPSHFLATALTRSLPRILEATRRCAEVGLDKFPVYPRLYEWSWLSWFPVAVNQSTAQFQFGFTFSRHARATAPPRNFSACLPPPFFPSRANQRVRETFTFKGYLGSPKVPTACPDPRDYAIPQKCTSSSKPYPPSIHLTCSSLLRLLFHLQGVHRLLYSQYPIFVWYLISVLCYQWPLFIRSFPQFRIVVAWFVSTIFCFSISLSVHKLFFPFRGPALASFLSAPTDLATYGFYWSHRLPSNTQCPAEISRTRKTTFGYCPNRRQRTPE